MNKQGFTLWECLLALLIFSGSLLLFHPFIEWLNLLQVREKESAYHNFQVGKIQLETEIQGLTFVGVKNNKLYFEKSITKTVSQPVVFEHYHQMIRKTKGHQPIMLQVEKVKFSHVPEMIRVEVMLDDGKEEIFFLFYKK